MPDYLAPGVYIEERAGGARPIEGVTTSTAAFLGSLEVRITVDRRGVEPPSWLTAGYVDPDVLDTLRRLVLAPAWTDQDARDPGVAIVELCAWLAEQVLYERKRNPKSLAPSAARLAATSLALLSSCDRPKRAALSVEAVVSSSGGIGYGVVEGLGIATGEGPKLHVEPGVAVGRMGGDLAPDVDGTTRQRRAVKRRNDP